MANLPQLHDPTNISKLIFAADSLEIHADNDIFQMTLIVILRLTVT